ncbi:MAG: DUF2130 domain-containing protein [Mycoplasmataceae bacterium]|nr:DUF2130 domain-containing protein [Mycoplasmataceae bacterium]
MKKIKQIIINPQNRQEIILQEDAAKDDVIDLNALHDINLDVSPINDFIEKFKDKALDERAKSIAEKEITIVRNRLQSEIDNINKTKENDIKVAIANTKEEYLQKYHEANNTIVKLESDLKSLSKDKDFEYRKLIEDKERSIEELKRENLNLRSKNKWEKFQQWDIYPDGGLENYCHDIYLNHINKFWPHISFTKDTQILDDEGKKSNKGTKGDFVLKEEDEEGFSFTISFECKNEREDNLKGLKIDKHYAQANMNRNKKGCKYSVIVTTLQPEMEFNIRQVQEYENMFIVRPEFFEDIIVQLRNTEYTLFQETRNLKNELIASKQENSDINDFWNKFDKGREQFKKHFVAASTKFEIAIAEIDKTIDHLQKTKEALLGSQNKLISSEGDLDDITIKRLSHNNPTIKKLFEKK